jgi:hypothetical protein
MDGGILMSGDRGELFDFDPPDSLSRSTFSTLTPKTSTFWEATCVRESASATQEGAFRDLHLNNSFELFQSAHSGRIISMTMLPFFMALACFALTSAQQKGLVLQDDFSALYIDDRLRIVNLVSTQLPLGSFLAPQDNWWSADYVAENINGVIPSLTTLTPCVRANASPSNTLRQQQPIRLRPLLAEIIQNRR